MSAIRTPKHRTRKRIVVNLKTGQTVNVAKIWAVSHKWPGCHYGKYYFRKDAEQGMIDQAGWSKELFIERIAYNHTLDDEGDLYNGWVDVKDPARPHETMREWNELLSQL